MPEFICNTSPLQYLFQIGRLDLLRELTGSLVVPAAVADELDVGRSLGLSLPDVRRLAWVRVQTPSAVPALPLVTDLGPGEKQVLALCLEIPQAVAVLDDAFARRVATVLRIRLIGTLGVLLEAKRRGIVSRIGPMLDELQTNGFRLAPSTRQAVLQLAGEAESQ